MGVDGQPGFPFCQRLFPKSHYFGLQDGLPHFALQTAASTEPKERPQSEVKPSGQAGGGFNKWSNWIMRLVLRSHKTERSRHLPAGILVYTDPGTRFRLISGPGDLSTSQGYILGAAPAAGRVDRKYPPRTEGRVRTLRLLIAGVHSVGQPAVSSCWWPVSSASNAFAPFYIWIHLDLGPLPACPFGSENLRWSWDGKSCFPPTVSHKSLRSRRRIRWCTIQEGLQSCLVTGNVFYLSPSALLVCVDHATLSWFVPLRCFFLSQWFWVCIRNTWDAFKLYGILSTSPLPRDTSFIDGAVPRNWCWEIQALQVTLRCFLVWEPLLCQHRNNPGSC